MNHAITITIASSLLLLTACFNEQEQSTKMNSSLKSSTTNKQLQQDYLIATLTADNINEFLEMIRRLKIKNNGKLTYSTTVKLFAKVSMMTESEQNIMMILVKGNMTQAHLPALTPLLFSDNPNIAISAFSLLTELNISPETKRLYLKLSRQSISDVVKQESKARLPRNMYL